MLAGGFSIAWVANIAGPEKTAVRVIRGILIFTTGIKLNNYRGIVSMRQIAVIDSETDPFLHGRIPQPFLWGFWDGEHYKEFADAIDLIAFLYDKAIIVYAHNGGKFDYHFLLDYIDPYTEITIINGRIAKFKIGECEFRDSYNIIPTSLSTFKKDEIDYQIFEHNKRNIPENWKKIKDYLMMDCKYLYEYVMAFIDRFGMNLTQAGTAMKVWQKISGREAPNDRYGINYKLFSPYYYGGRCQAFEFGLIQGPLKMVDIRSAYPYAMLSKHPISLDYQEVKIHDIYDLAEADRGPSLHQVVCVAHGCFPFRGDDGSLYFPNDDVERLYYVTGWELLAAYDTGTVERAFYHKSFVFEETIDFSEYILHFFEERKQAKARGDKAGDIFSKLLMNSLYGKFGSCPDEYRNYMIVEPSIFDEHGQIGSDDGGEPWDFGGEFGPWALAERPLSEDEQRFYNVATAASITGYVRAYLWRAICLCGGVAYCDTDSIVARDVSALRIGDNLGDWSLDDEFSDGAIAGRKLYAFKSDLSGYHKIASKGVRLSAEQIYKIAQGATVTYEPMAPVFSVHKGPHFLSRRVKMTEKYLQEKPCVKSNKVA